MLNLPRKSLLIIAIVCFLAMATGLTLILHLSGVEHPENHDSEHCRICQQVFINPTKAVMPVELVVICENIILLYRADFVFDTPVVIEEVPSCMPRAPPLNVPSFSLKK